MDQKVKELFKSPCGFWAKTFHEGLLDAATPAVLGQLFFNRMQAIADGAQDKHGLLGKVNCEFRNSLKVLCDCKKEVERMIKNEY